jgi:O-antigen ligase
MFLSTNLLMLGLAGLLGLFLMRREEAAIFFLLVTLGAAATWYWPIKVIALQARWGFIGVMLLHYFRNRTEARGTDLVDRLFLAFIALCFLSVRYSIDKQITFLRSLLLLFMYWVVFREMFRFLSKKGGIAKFKAIVTWYVKLLFTLNVLMFLSRNPAGYVSERFRGIFENPNTVGLFGCIGLPVLFSAFVEGKGKPLMKRSIDFTFLFIGATCLILSASRTGLVSALLGIFVYFTISPGKKNKYVIWASIAAFLFYQLGLNIIPQLEPILRADSLSNLSGRTEAWQTAFDLIKQRPLLGYGYGTEDMIFSFHGIEFLSHAGMVVHNSFIGIAMMTGYLGFIIFAGILVRITLYGYRLYQVRETLGEVRPIADLSISVLMAGLFSAFTESWLVAIGGIASMLFWTFAMIVFLLYSHFVRGQGIIKDVDDPDTITSPIAKN